MREIKKDSLDAFENQDYQFDQLVMKLGVEREHHRNPIFNTQFTFQNAEVQAGEIPGLHMEPYEYESQIYEEAYRLMGEAKAFLNLHKFRFY